MDGVQLLDERLFAELIDRAMTSPRKRTNHNFHPSLDDNPHRFLNVMCRGTYVTPHRHLDPPKSESFVILRGEVAFFLFDERGEVTRCERLGDAGQSARACGIDVAPGLYHSLAVLSSSAICYEVKPGPYTASNDKDFAPWAPREGSAECEAWLAALLAQHGL